MRIRKAAIAGATAFAVAFSGVAAASAENNPAETGKVVTDPQNDGDSKETPNTETDTDKNETVAKDSEGSSLNSSKPRRDTDSEGNLINNNDKKDSTLSAKIGGSLEATKPADGRKIFGDDADLSSQPKWAQALYGVGIASIIITILGGLVGPVLNFIKYGPFTK